MKLSGVTPALAHLFSNTHQIRFQHNAICYSSRVIKSSTEQNNNNIYGCCQHDNKIHQHVSNMFITMMLNS